VGHVVRMGEVRNAYKILVGKPDVKRALGWPKCRWISGKYVGDIWTGFV